jgi:hydroxymethylpyrimidine pyrophosphatase-like HAD family hydrolase
MKNYLKVLMKVLLVTEKFNPDQNQRDGGSRVVTTLKQEFGESLYIMNFGSKINSSATWSFEYPVNFKNRFEKRIANAEFIAKQVKCVEKDFTHVIFVHISMQFGLIKNPLRQNITIWTFPMFLTPSYIASNEIIPEAYTLMEHSTLANSKNIITPSYLEKRQLMNFYSVLEKYIHVVPRGVNMEFITPKVRIFTESPKFCSIGSIKPQKNTLELINLFFDIRSKFPKATLKIIGPIQNMDYYQKIISRIKFLKLSKVIEITGYVSPDKISLVLKDLHIHLSTSACETFGRSIFETLAFGLPNIVRVKKNAAAEFLKDKPYIRFVKDNKEALSAVKEMLLKLPKLSSMGLEIGKIYDDEVLAKLLIAKIMARNHIAISDFDGTLYHKDDSQKTKKYMECFQKFPIKVICSARPVCDLLDQVSYYNIKVDWIIGYSGAMVVNDEGELLWLTKLEKDDISKIEEKVSDIKRIEVNNEVLQLSTAVRFLPDVVDFHTEIYQDTAFISHREATKLHAVHKLLRYINWSGQVSVFGDGVYDIELLNYFDGVLVTPSTHYNVIKGRANV